jgi:hypothetical protein
LLGLFFISQDEVYTPRKHHQISTGLHITSQKIVSFVVSLCTVIPPVLAFVNSFWHFPFWTLIRKGVCPCRRYQLSYNPFINDFKHRYFNLYFISFMIWTAFNNELLHVFLGTNRNLPLRMLFSFKSVPW